jgi:undecaprenyl-diphosphatase
VALRGKQAIGFMALFAGLFLALSFAIHQPGMEAFDLRFTKSVQQARSPIMDVIATAFTTLGNSPVLVALGVLVAAWMVKVRRPRAAILVAVSLLGLPLNMLLKEIVERPRPDRSVVEVLLPTFGLSFPSGHAMASTMFYGFLAFMAWVHIPNQANRVRIAVALGLTAVLVSLSRIYVGAHWLSDVVGGWTAGLFCLVLLAEVYKHWNRQDFAPVAEEKLVHPEHEPAAEKADANSRVGPADRASLL